MHQTPREGTLEREVDDYLLAGGEHNSLGRYSTTLSVDEKKLIARGFEAIPVLLKLRHSQRLTGHIMPGFNNFPSHYLSVGRVVDSYIQSFANDEFADFLDVQKGYQPTDELIDKWWRQAQALGEEEYVRRYAIAVDGHGRARTSYPLVHLAKVKYPKFLIELFKRANDHDVDDTPIIEAILESYPFVW